MRSAHVVSVVRDAEQALMDRLPGGALMRRAATGLAVHCARMLPRVDGSRVTLMVGGGDNGGDALHAGASLAARGASVRAKSSGRAQSSTANSTFEIRSRNSSGRSWTACAT